ncbi:Response regulator receiver modulated diguanylate cyclase/phosphodiesterase [Hyella patelloides LEGE 07179]|uniref:Response regulator receiver modulated diguanylate cyclase/phosphodiesterase n=1 Tax=Hyella patelloides LEGE 07179 TaxID=945734 RepID=A0A563VLM2_9CYAN|nr:EAL domain-containing protein [Hyella patelloides]VEP12339.1 Response regulator receiver modulated diguanylate cyclase/phosphodiesterase [Hyella patelloides LEGE 07179]
MNRINILIVEDELLIAKNTAKKLRNLGYNVPKIVSSGQAAIDYISSENPDLILMDIAIKGAIDGIDTATEIKTKKDIPIVFLTAYASDDTLERASQTGCYGYLIKPFRDKELQATIKMVLSKHEEQSVIQKSLQDTINQYSSQLDNVYVNSLTNLPNRLFLRDSFDYLVSSLDSKDKDSIPEKDNLTEYKSNLIAVYNINLDRFKKISSFLTKDQQNTLVKEVAQRLTNYISNLDFQGITVYIKEDHFITMIPLDKQITARNYGQEILDMIRQAFHIDRQEIFISASIGISFYPSDSFDIEELLKQSEKAIEYARSQGGNRCQSFTFAFNIKTSRASENLNMEAELHYALERKELELYYQPKINLETNLIFGAEALVRWNHPTMGRIAPHQFIPLAEETGLIKPIGEWIINRACRQTKAWHNAGLDFLTIGVNLSGVQFKQSDLFHKITQILFNSSLEPQYLELELTETILIENIKINIQRLNLMKKIGVQIALDDFGTGYSSLSYLQQFPFDTLKIDASFIRNIDSNEVNAVITKTIIEMAHKLGLKVVAEGVETKAELKFLRECKCDIMQGFLFSRPLIARDFKNLAFDNIKSTAKNYNPNHKH